MSARYLKVLSHTCLQYPWLTTRRLKSPELVTVMNAVIGVADSLPGQQRGMSLRLLRPLSYFLRRRRLVLPLTSSLTFMC